MTNVHKGRVDMYVYYCAAHIFPHMTMTWIFLLRAGLIGLGRSSTRRDLLACLSMAAEFINCVNVCTLHDGKGVITPALISSTIFRVAVC